jgi:hypothetical protein
MNPIDGINQEFTRMVVAEWDAAGEPRERHEGTRGGLLSPLRGLLAALLRQPAEKQARAAELRARRVG